MTRNEYLSALRAELKRRGADDIEDILAEYAEHFACKLADGYSEEEIAARLGEPAQIAAQFDTARGEARGGGRGAQRGLTGFALGFADILVFSLFCLLWSWVAVLACGAFAGTMLALALLIPGFSELPWVYLPYMPYWCGAVLALALAALGVLFACGTVYFAALARQSFRAWARFHSNAMARAAGRAARPGLPIWPVLPPQKRRRLRLAALVSLAAALLFTLLGFAACASAAGRVEFWHEWKWFWYV